MDSREDCVLVELAKSGDDDAYGALFDRYRGAIFRLAVKRLGDPYLAEDVVQDTFVRARRLSTYDPTKRLLPWLASVALNRAADIWHQQAKSQPSGLAPDVASGRTSDTTWETTAIALERDRLRRALKRLSPKQRLALLLHDLEGMPYAEVASLVGTTQLAARSLVFRARATMRSVLRTLGLIVLGIRIRLSRRRADPFATNEWALSLGSVSLSVVLALTVISGPYFGGSSGAASNSSQAAAVSAVDPAAPPQGTNQPNDLPPPAGANEAKPRAAGAVRWQADVSPKQPGTVVPAGAKFGIDIVSPSGQTIYYMDTWLDCKDVGKLPNIGPVRSAC